LEPEIGKSANEVTFREDSIMEVNGEAIFPVGTYYLPGSESLQSWGKMKKAEINTIFGWHVTEKELNRAELFGIKTVAYLPETFPDKGETIDIKVLKRFRKSSSSIAYLGADEPDFTLRRKLFLDPLIQLKELDSDHPSAVVFAESPPSSADSFSFPLNNKTEYKGNPNDLSGLPDSMTCDEFYSWYTKKSGSEIVSFDYYYSSDIKQTVGIDKITKNYVKRLRNGEFGQNAKTIWVTLSAHSEKPLIYENMRFQAIDAIARGATGISWWDWPPETTVENDSSYPGGGKGYSVHWEKIQSISKELDEVKNGLIGKEVFIGENISGNVACKITKSERGKYFIFSACTLDTERTGNNEMIPAHLANTTFEVVGENRRVTSDKDGCIKDSFNVLSAHIYAQV
jgi:hypothetical protein